LTCDSFLQKYMNSVICERIVARRFWTWKWRSFCSAIHLRSKPL